MFCFAKYLSQSPFFEKFLKSEGGAGGREELFPKKFLSPPCYYDSPLFAPYTGGILQHRQERRITLHQRKILK